MTTNKFNTGDLLFFHGNKKSLIDDLIMDVSDSPYSHVGMIIVDPKWDETLKGPYLLQSTSGYTYSEEDREEEKGVTLASIPENFEGVDIRRYEGTMNTETLEKVHDEVHHLPYDTAWWDWIKAGLSHLGFSRWVQNERHDNNFWCSALVAFVYVKMGILPEKTNWSNLAPGDLAQMTIDDLGPIESLKKDEENEFDYYDLHNLY